MMSENPIPENVSATNMRTARRDNVQKAKDILKYMRNDCNKFSLAEFLKTLFTSDDGDLRKSANMFLKSGKATGLMNEWMGRIPEEEMEDWIMEKATRLCVREFSWLTDRASQGPHNNDAKSLRIHSDSVTVSLLEGFQLKKLTALYDRTMPNFQRILLAVIGKDNGSQGQTTSGTTRDINAGGGQIPGKERFSDIKVFCDYKSIEYKRNSEGRDSVEVTIACGSAKYRTRRREDEAYIIREKS
ncbi:hypothetical protein BDN70DRAFT_926329 [Pholiota conissans]|uniref:Uncharacterized protein n=1 Tax=Pholiota conissans TaxID=109636 RepID=A0A9P5YKQ0_9AGAR|nr:hypothetical protein BDN70DRAFT_926329 [Pholiota conissans]